MDFNLTLQITLQEDPQWFVFQYERELKEKKGYYPIKEVAIRQIFSRIDEVFIHTVMSESKIASWLFPRFTLQTFM